MKTVNFVLFVLTLLGVIAASNKSGDGGKRIRRTRIDEPVRAASSTETDSQAFAPRPFPVHRLLMMAQPCRKDEETDAKVGVDERTKSVSVEAEKSRKRKAIIDSENVNDFDDMAAVDALLSMGKSGGAAEVELEDEFTKVKKEKTEVKLPPFLKITDKLLFNDSIKKYSSYFDKRNMAKEGCATLFNCMSNSMGLKVATYLIKNGARLADNEDTAIIALAAKEEGQGLRTEMFKILLEEDATTVTKIFIRAAGMTEAGDESVDMYFFGLLVEIVDELLETKVALVLELIEILAESDRMINSINLLLGDRERTLELFCKALKGGNDSFVELLLELNLVNINEMIRFSAEGKAQSVASALFGRFEPRKILDFMRRFNYYLTTSNDPEVNPEGDILLSATRDLNLFRKLLLLGASINVRVEGQSLEVYLLSEGKVEFYAAIQSFKMGTLQAEVDAEEAEDIDVPGLKVAAPVSSSSANSSSRVVIDLTFDD